MSQQDSTDSSESLLGGAATRRKFIAAAGGGFFVSLSGCGGTGGDGDGGDTTTTTTTESGDGGGGEDTTTTESSGDEPKIYDHAFIKPMNFNPVEKQWNPFGPGLVGMEFSPFVSEVGGFHRGEGVFQARDLGDSYDHQGDQLDLTIREDYSWHNGRDTLIDDLIMGWRLNHHVFGNSGLWAFTDRIEKTGDYSCRFHFNKEINPNVALGQEIITERLHTPRWVFKPYLESLQDAQGDMSISEARKTDAHKQAVAELENFAWFPNDDASPEVVRTGPFQLEEVQPSMMRFTLYEDHPGTVFNEGKINFSEARAIGANQNNPNLWINDQVDGRELGIPANDKLPKKIQEKARVNNVPLFQANTLVLNHQRTEKLFGNRNVRKALQYVIDRSVVEKNLRANLGFSSAAAYKKPTNLLGAAGSTDPLKVWLGEDRTKFDAYDPDRNRAAELLRGEGFSKDGGTWHKPNGDTWSLQMIGGSNEAEVKLAVQTATDQLQEFGVDVNLRLVDRTTVESRYQSGNYDIIGDLIGQGDPYPYGGFQAPWQLSEIEEGLHVPNKKEYEIPTMDGSGTRTVNVRDLLDRLAAATDRETEVAAIKDLAWTWNQTLPMIHLVDRGLREAVMGAPEWDIPPKDHDTWQLHRFGVQWIFQLGTIGKLPEN